jgi:2-keto-4-pentenoate hydratase/2-oxohepta-3-ene-1,7-dioic acid hydratase in catechol pathway
MYFKIDEIIEFTARHISLNEGDLILTGTPLGAGPLRLSDKV